MQMGWRSREAIRRYSTVVVVMPFGRHHCCCGCLTLAQGTVLIAVFELVLLGTVKKQYVFYAQK